MAKKNTRWQRARQTAAAAATPPEATGFGLCPALGLVANRAEVERLLAERGLQPNGTPAGAMSAAEVRKAAREYAMGRRPAYPMLFRPDQEPARVIDATKNGGRLRVHLLGSGLWHTLEAGDYVK